MVHFETGYDLRHAVRPSYMRRYVLIVFQQRSELPAWATATKAQRARIRYRNFDNV